MLIIWGLLLFGVGIFIQNYSVEVRQGMNETGYKKNIVVYLWIFLVCWTLLVLGGLVLLFLQAWWLPIIALIIGARFVRKNAKINPQNEHKNTFITRTRNI